MSPRTVRFAAAVGLGLTLTVAMQAALGLPYRVRFSNSAANYWAVAVLAALFPLCVFCLSASIRQAWLRRTGFVAAGLILLPSLAFTSCALLEAPRVFVPDASYVLLSEVRAEQVAYRLYRTNCGATCAFGLELRKEHDLFFGLRLVSPKWSMYHASEGAVKLEPSSVLVVKGEQILARVGR